MASEYQQRQQKLTLTQFGITTLTGELIADPGVLRVAHNVVNPAPGRVEKTKGFKSVTRTLPAATAATNSVISNKTFGQNVLLNTGATVGLVLEASKLYYGDGYTNAWWDLTTPDSRTVLNDSYTRMKSSVNQKTVYLTEQRAPLRIDGGIEDATTSALAIDALEYAGMPQAPGIDYRQQQADELVDGGVSNWLTPQYCVAYRVVFGIKDYDGNERLSPPSGRYIISNVSQVAGYTGGALCPTLTFVIPYITETKDVKFKSFPGVDNGNRAVFARVFRTQMFDVSVQGAPDDEMQLCYELYLNYSQIKSGYFSFVDTCPPAGLTMALYTNQNLGGDVSSGVLVAGSTGLGLASKNDRPPVAKDTSLFADCTFWANYTTPYRLQISLLGVGAEEGDPLLSPGDTFDVINPAGVALQSFTAVAGAPASETEFKIEAGYASIAVNIRQTVMNLCSSINSFMHKNKGLVVAVYNGSDASVGTIGQFYLEMIRSEDDPNVVSIGAFSVGAGSSNLNCWLPQQVGTETDGAGWVFTQETAPNGLAISKPFQGDAVPPVNYIRVGRSDTVIQRILPTTNALYILCDDGVYWLKGTAPTNFQIERLDPTCRIWFRESAVTLNDSVYLWAKEGLFQIQNGTTIRLDSAIRGTIESVRFNNSDAICARSNFAWSNPFENTVTFCWANWDTANDGAGGSPFQAFVWNANSGSWTTRQMNTFDNGSYRTAKSCAVARWSDGAVFLGCPYDNGFAGQVATDVAYSSSGLAPPVYYDSIGTSSTPTTTYPLTSTMEWVTSVPNPGGICHWSEFQAFSQAGSLVANSGVPNLDLAYNINENGQNPSFPIVDKFDVKISNEIGEYHTSVTINPTTPQGRCYLATAGGYSTRQIVRVEHTLNAAGSSAGCSFTGFAIVYRPVSGRTTR